jgi:hypothetical protein
LWIKQPDCRGDPTLGRGLHRGLSHPEQDFLLARDPFQLLDDLRLGVRVDPVHRGDQQVDEGIGDVPLPAVQVRRAGGEAAGRGEILWGHRAVWSNHVE